MKKGTTKYRLSRYGGKAWQIEVLRTPKNGEPEWEAWRYPGNLSQAAHAILDMEIDGSYEDIPDLIAAVEDARERIITAIGWAMLESDLVVLEISAKDMAEL